MKYIQKCRATVEISESEQVNNKEKKTEIIKFIWVHFQLHLFFCLTRRAGLSNVIAAT